MAIKAILFFFPICRKRNNLFPAQVQQGVTH
jgi:hypothetical protein